jgi:thermostable 8-oxoguanine DNA glycosylase
VGWVGSRFSNFLRNVGYRNVAIIDRHVLNLLCKYQVIHSKPKALTRKPYLEIEKALRAFADNLNFSSRASHNITNISINKVNIKYS